MKSKKLARNNIILLVCLLGLIILFPLFRDKNDLIRDLLLTAVLFSGVFSLDFSTRSLKILLPLATATVATIWLNHFFTNHIIHLIDFTTTFLFLIATVVLMIGHIARSQNVTATIILSSINGYMLLGLLSAVLLAIADTVHLLIAGTGTHGIIFPGQADPQFNDYMYFSFVTLTTLGYGDVTPVSHLSRSMAMLIAVTGQLYMTILIALLVGKFLARSERT